MLERLVASVDAWSKAAKQQKKGQAPMGKPPVRAPVGRGIQPLPHPDTQRGSQLRPQLREGDLGPGIPIPRMIPPTGPPPALPPAGPPGRAGEIRPNQPTRPTGPPALRVVPPPQTRQPNAPATTDGRATPPASGAPTAADLERARQEADLLNAGNRGRANVHGTYPYDRYGHGPTEKYMSQNLRDQMLQLRSKAPNLFFRGTALRPREFTPEEQRNAKWDDGTPITLEEMYLGGYMGKPTQEDQLKQQRLQRQILEENLKQQRLQMQMQRPDLYGAPGTTFRQPRGGARPGQGGTGGPLGANQRAMEDLLRLQKQVPPTGPLPRTTSPAQQQPTARRRR